MSSKAAQVWRRTRVGGALALLLTLLLWVASRSETGHVVLFTGWAVGLAAVWEVTRMGGLARRGLAVVLVPAHALVLFETLGQGVGAGPEVRAETIGLVVVFALVLELGRRLGRRWTGAPPIPAAGPWGRGLPAVLAPAILVLWLCPPLPWLWYVWGGWGTAGLVALVVLSKIGDIAGYYVGNAIGKTHPFPGISPGKTTAGCVASLAAGVGVGALLAAGGTLPEGRLGVLGGALAGGIVNLAAQAGDLGESWVKRRSGVKDSGTLFGPSGGFLDLVDSFLLSVPAALATWPWIFSD